MQSALSSSQGHDASAPSSASASASDSHQGDRKQQPARKRGRAKGLFAQASREDSLPGFIEALEVARCPTPGQAEDHVYADIIRTGLFFSIMNGRTSLVAYLLENEPRAPAILRERIAAPEVGENPSIALFDLLIVQHGWDINTEGGLQNDKRPLISWVLRHQHEHELVCWLLDHNARVDFGEEDYGLWPRPPALLETCARFGSVESFKLLQAKGAKLGRRTLHLSCGIAAFYGADPSVSNQDQEDLGRKEEFGEEGTTNLPSDPYSGALALVTRSKKAAMLRYLVDEVGLNVNQTDTDKIGIDGHYGTPICYAAREKRGAAVVKWLLAKGADPLYRRYNIDAEACARASSPEVRQVLEQWRELNPEKVEKRNLSGIGLETPTKWRGRTWEEWEEYKKGLGGST